MRKIFCIVLLVTIALVSMQSVYAYENKEDVGNINSLEQISTQSNITMPLAFVDEDEIIYSSNGDNKPLIDDTIDELNPDKVYVEPTYEDEESCLDGGMMPMGDWTVTRDQYEANNSFASARDMSLDRPEDVDPHSYGSGRSFTATIHKEPWYLGGALDEDYYRFDFYYKVQITVDLTNIPSGVDYDLELHQHKNIRYSKATDIERIGITVSTHGLSK